MDNPPNNQNQIQNTAFSSPQPVVTSSKSSPVQGYQQQKRRIKIGVVIIIILAAAIISLAVWLIMHRESISPDTQQLPAEREVIPLTPEMEMDRDLDGVPNDVEDELGTSSEEFDSDGDGLSDQYEIEIGSDPTNVDTDGDGFLDGIEVLRGYNPNGPGNLPTN